MGVLKEDGTDGASIKPVSSLRSHFENISVVDSNLQAAANSIKIGRGADLDSRHGDLKTIARASLDIPRRPSQWSTPDTGFDAPRPINPGIPIPRPHRLNSAILQRPASMTSLSEPRSPPRVTVDSPPSPLKSPSGTGSRHLQQISPKPFINPSLRPQALPKSPIPPQRPLSRSSVAQRKEALPAENALSNLDLKTPHQAFASNQSETAAKAMPPPVNRADKPKIPIKPPEFSTRTNLEPISASVDERVSPFSTPPSSDEGESSRSAFPIENKRKFVRQLEVQAPMMRQASSVSTPKPLYGEVEDVRVLSQPKRHIDARASGFAQQQVPHVRLGDDPPGLPPRRVQGRGIIDETSSDLTPMNKNFQIQALQRTGVMHQRGTSSNSNSNTNFQIPPKRVPVIKPPEVVISESDHNLKTASKSLDAGSGEETALDADGSSNRASEYPDTSNMNRLPPYCSLAVPEIEMIYDARLLDICGQYVCTAGHVTRVWDIVSGDSVLNFGYGEKEIKVTALAFKPGATASEEGTRMWLGTNHGELQEVDIASESIVYAKSGAHGRREIAKIYRHQNSMWTLDDGGMLCVWLGDDSGLPNLQGSPLSHRLPRGHTFSLITQDTLWFATGKDIRVFRPLATEGSAFALLQSPLGQPGIGSVSAGGVIAGQTDRVYFGHADGKVSIYSTKDFSCLGVVSVSVYKISCLAGAGFYLWAGYNTGMIYAYDTRTHPWTTKKEWLAHHNSPVINIVVDHSSLWKTSVLRVTSIGSDNAVRFWDGTLENDWLDDDMQSHDVEYCSFREITAMVVSWNAGAATPTHLRYEDKDPPFFQDLFQTTAPPDLLVFGFQELVDLEDKKLTAKTLFKGNKRKDPMEQDHMSRQYRAWRDYLVRCLEDSMPSSEPYHLLHTASMVGLFSCVFIKASQRSHIRDVSAAEIKRGMGGLHGNKGALILRFVLDDSSVCLVNCHLAAGQTQTVNRNNDMTAILESAILPAERNPLIRRNVFVGGGDGSMVLDNEICILNGDLNYRIDTMGRDTVVKAVNANNFTKLLERDQLLVSRRRNPGFRVRAFREAPITFAPTYKYDVGSDRYDTSEKRRAPAWCDRILFRGPGKIKQMDYRRHELRISDHRPVSGLFKIRVKTVFADKREHCLRESNVRFAKVKEKLAGEAKVLYLRDVLGVPPEEARRLI